VLHTVDETRVTAMTVQGSCFIGVFFANSKNSQLEATVVTDVQIDGVALGRSDFITVEGNTISRSGRTGVDISDFSKSNTIARNIITENGGDGVAIFNGDSNTVRDNAVRENESGIRLSSPGNTANRALGNVVHSNDHTGIYILLGAGQSRVNGNTVLRNGVQDMQDGNAGCGTNRWPANLFEIDFVAGMPDGGPGAGSIR
jgi:parallel beta-helix repeat protein